MVKSEKYWVSREKEHMLKQIKDEKKMMAEIGKRYEESYVNIQKEIDAFYANYAGKEKINQSEARKRASEFDVKAFAKKAKKYVETRDFSSRANDELRLYNLTMKVNRLELLKANIGLELIDLYDGLDKYMEGKLSQSAIDEMVRQSGILGETVWKNHKFVKEVVNSSFYNATFSENLWSDMQGLKSDLDKALTKGITQGKNPKVLAREISRNFMTIKGKENAVFITNRLLISELSRVQAAVQEGSYKKYGYDEYDYIPELSACDLCKEVAKKNPHKTKDMQVGLNMYPMHNFCKCSTSAHFNREAWNADLKARGL